MPCTSLTSVAALFLLAAHLLPDLLTKPSEEQRDIAVVRLTG